AQETTMPTDTAASATRAHRRNPPAMPAACQTAIRVAVSGTCVRRLTPTRPASPLNNPLGAFSCPGIIASSRARSDLGCCGVAKSESVGLACDTWVVRFTFDAELWLWDVRRAEGWTFVSLPAEASAEIRDLLGAVPRRGFGSLRVKVTVGGSTW